MNNGLLGKVIAKHEAIINEEKKREATLNKYYITILIILAILSGAHYMEWLSAGVSTAGSAMAFALMCAVFVYDLMKMPKRPKGILRSMENSKALRDAIAEVKSESSPRNKHGTWLDLEEQWPPNWRHMMTDGSPKELRIAERYKSPRQVWKSLRDCQCKVSQGGVDRISEAEKKKWAKVIASLSQDQLFDFVGLNRLVKPIDGITQTNGKDFVVDMDKLSDAMKRATGV